MQKESAKEVKVGALVVFGVAILVAFVLVLGDCTVGRDFMIYVDFNDAAGLKAGAELRVSGYRAGSVRKVEFMGGQHDPEVDRPVYVRAHVLLDREMESYVRQDSEFTITTQGVLGEPYIASQSRDPSAASARDGQIFEGIDPPRLDMIISAAYESLQSVRDLVNNLGDTVGSDDFDLKGFVNNISSLAGSLDERVRANEEHIDSIIASADSILETGRDRLPGLVDEVESTLVQYRRLGSSLNTGVQDGQAIRRIIRDAEEVAAVAAREIDPTLQSIREATDTASRLLTENEDSINRSIAHVEAALETARGAVDDVAVIVERIERGEGTVGRLLSDEELFDDMREFVRELKRRPWRMIWKD